MRVHTLVAFSTVCVIYVSLTSKSVCVDAATSWTSETFEYFCSELVSLAVFLAGALPRGPQDHQRGEEAAWPDDWRDAAAVRRLHHAGLHGRQPAQNREE